MRKILIFNHYIDRPTEIEVQSNRPKIYLAFTASIPTTKSQVENIQGTRFEGTVNSVTLLDAPRCMLNTKNMER